MTAVTESSIVFIAPAKIPTDKQWYGFLLSKWLKGDTIVSVVWSFLDKDGVVTTDLTLVQQAIGAVNTSATVQIKDGVSQSTYTVLGKVTTILGNIKTFGFILQVI